MYGFVPRSLAVVGIVGVLSFAMPVAASADINDVFALVASTGLGGAGGALAGEGVIAAAPEMAGTAGFACAAALPVCAAVGGAVIGATLYLTRDTWLPWFTGGALFGADANSTPCVNAGSPSWCGLTVLSFHAGSPTKAAGENVQIDTSNPTRTSNMVFWGDIECQSAAGVLWATRSYSTGGWTAYNGDGVVQRNSGQCPVGYTLNWITVHGGWDGGQMTNNLSWGSPLGQGVAPSVASLQVNCTNPNGSQYSVTSSVPSANGLVQMPTCTGAVGDLGGAHAKCVTLSAGTTLASLLVQSSDCIAAATSAALYPECVAAGCQYQVYVDGVPCTVGRVGCTDWARTYAGSPGRVGCRYGTHWVSADKCFFLERVYESLGAPVAATDLNTDGNPATWTGPAPLPNPGTQPEPQPTAIPYPGAPGGAPVPITPTAPLPGPTAPPTTAGDCWGTLGASWNPLDWVLKPVECALSWAFVPSSAQVSGPIADFKTTWNSKPPGSLIVGATSVFSSIGSGWNGGCSGSASASFSQPALGHPLQLPCTPTGGGSGTVPYTAMQIALIVATLIYVWHMVAAGISAQATGAGD